MPDRQRAQVVLVDDQDVVRDTYAKLLSHFYDVETFASGEALLGALDRVRPSLCLIDWLMPGLDGLALCGEIRKQPQFALVPIAFLTSVDPTPANIQAALDAGAQSFMAKSQATSFVLAQVRALVDSHERMSGVLRQRQIVFSALKHELLNLLTGVSTGVEILAMHPAFKDEDLRRQVQGIMSAGKGLRMLIQDLSELAATDGSDRRVDFEPVDVSGLLDDVRGYVKSIRRSVIFQTIESAQACCGRRSLGRAIYYLVRLLHSHTPYDAPLAVRVAARADGVAFRVSVRGSFKDAIQASIDQANAPPGSANPYELLFVHYLQTVLRSHHSKLTVEEVRQETEAGFLVPTQPSAD